MGWVPERQDALRNQDPMIAVIASYGRQLSYARLRNRAGRGPDIWHTLDRGMGILKTVAQLDQYIYSYGPMVSCQWINLRLEMGTVTEPLRLIDYGCGQGLAGLLLHDMLGPTFCTHLSQVVLIEGSDVSLVRAEAVYRAIAPNADIVCIEKNFDEIERADLKSEGHHETLHVFSNVLDIPDFDSFDLFVKSLSPGRNMIIAVSSDRSVVGGTDRIRNLEEVIQNPENSPHFSNIQTKIETFTCGDNGKYAVVSWIASFDYHDV